MNTISGTGEVTGSHRGKGPKDFTRLDSRIEEDINDALTESSFIDASNTEVSVKDATAILSGTVATREMKRRADDLMDTISGLKNIENRLHEQERFNSAG